MQNKNTTKEDRRPTEVGKRLIEALTQQEMAQLLDALFVVLPPEWRDEGLKQLQDDTRLTIQHIVVPPIEEAEANARPIKTASIAKLEQTWSDLWSKWEGIVMEASEEDGEYINQDEHWEPPYFDEYAFISDLEKVAEQMRPLIQSAFEYDFEPDVSFAGAISDAEQEVESYMPEWIQIVNGFDLEKHLTACLLEGEWLIAKAKDPDAFSFAEQVIDWESVFKHTSLHRDTFFAFFTNLPEAEQQAIFVGLQQNKDQPLWQRELNNPYSHWHTFYIHAVERYAPERYLDSLRATISQQWKNGLPVVEDFLAKQEYATALDVVQETVTSMLSHERHHTGWTPEHALLYANIGWHEEATRLAEHKKLLHYYKKTVEGLGQTDRAHALALQLLAFEHFFDWSAMFNAFRNDSVPQPVRQALFNSWLNRIIAIADPSTSYWRRIKSADWWLVWLLEGMANQKKGPAWFQQRMNSWLTHISKHPERLDEDLPYLRLLTEDLDAAAHTIRKQYPKFYEVVIHVGGRATKDSASRQANLQEYGPDTLLDQVMACWKGNLRAMVPNPKNAKNSDYSSHARWMLALSELAPKEYNLLLAEWRTTHRRRRNLWRDMREVGLG